jgi:hypothetical protein
MKRTIFITITVFLVLLQGACFSEPRVAFEETAYNFGEVQTEQELKHIFKFRNLGNATLVIKKIEAG